MKFKDKLIKYGVPALIGLALSVAVMYIDESRVKSIEGISFAEMVFMCLSDGFFVTGILYVGFGLLLFAAHEGIFDIISYGFKSVLYLFTPLKKDPDAGGYYEYKMKKKESRKAIPYHVIAIGAAFIILATAFCIVTAAI